MLLAGILPGAKSMFDWKRVLAERPELADHAPDERDAILEQFEKDAYDWIVGFQVAGALPTVLWFVIMSLKPPTAGADILRVLLLTAAAWLAWLAIKGGLEPWAAQRLFTRWWNRSPRQSER